MLAPLISAESLAILQKAVDTALQLASSRNIELTVNDLAAHISKAFEAGERDPAKLAQAVLSDTASALH